MADGGVAGPLAHRRMGHLPALDGLRGIAIALVVCVHLYAPVFSGGNAGVDLFFVLSGFLITKLAYEEHESSGTFSKGAFYHRRVFRIFPPLFVMLAVLLVASFTWLSDVGDNLRREIALSAASMGNLWPFFYGFEPREVLGHTWSLAIEEQFYLCWPLLLSVVPIAFRRPRRFALWVGIGAMGLVVFSRGVLHGLLEQPHWQSVPISNVDGLALGCILAILLHHDETGWSARLPLWPAAVAATIVAVDFVAARAYVDHDSYWIRPLVLRLCFGYLVTVVVTRPSLPFVKPLLTAPLQWLGRLSYSLYLWHVPLFTMFDDERHPDVPKAILIVGKLVVSFGAAYASYRFVEQPLIRLGRTLRARRSAVRQAELAR